MMDCGRENVFFLLITLSLLTLCPAAVGSAPLDVAELKAQAQGQPQAPSFHDLPTSVQESVRARFSVPRTLVGKFGPKGPYGYYALLRVLQNASDDSITRAVDDLVRSTTAKAAESSQKRNNRVRRLVQAGWVLRNPITRRMYDNGTCVAYDIVCFKRLSMAPCSAPDLSFAFITESFCILLVPLWLFVLRSRRGVGIVLAALLMGVTYEVSATMVWEVLIHNPQATRWWVWERIPVSVIASWAASVPMVMSLSDRTVLDWYEKAALDAFLLLGLDVVTEVAGTGHRVWQWLRDFPALYDWREASFTVVRWRRIFDPIVALVLPRMRWELWTIPLFNYWSVCGCVFVLCLSFRLLWDHDTSTTGSRRPTWSYLCVVVLGCGLCAPLLWLLFGAALASVAGDWCPALILAVLVAVGLITGATSVVSRGHIFSGRPAWFAGVSLLAVHGLNCFRLYHLQLSAGSPWEVWLWQGVTIFATVLLALKPLGPIAKTKQQ